ncbi:MAG: helix-turn-helix transcriptional regulator [Clostridia bacterium]|nr:helix-turn-helix transcriptional regulator [Clostridia bacterium]MBQ3044314.1 helix-turn-helix transcriptional regulator [Clostridia bacterium]
MVSDAKIRLGEIILKLREENKYTQEKLGNIIGVNRQTISAYERGLRAPTIEQLIVLAKEFHVTTDYLLGLSDNITNEMDLQVADYTGLDICSVKKLNKAYSAYKQAKNETFYNTSKILNENYFLFCNHFICNNVCDPNYIVEYSKNLYERNLTFENLCYSFKELSEYDFSQKAIVCQNLEDFKNKCFSLHQEHQEMIKKIGHNLFSIFSRFEKRANERSFFELAIMSERMLGRIDEIEKDRERQKRKYRKWHGEQIPYPEKKK